MTTPKPSSASGKAYIELPDAADQAPAAPDKCEQDKLLDEALRETFPASDPIASGKFD